MIIIRDLLTKWSWMDQPSETTGLSRPSSVKKSESSLMRWCMRALTKAEREVLFPPKPTRPKSFPSSVNSGEAKKERGVFFFTYNNYDGNGDNNEDCFRYTRLKNLYDFFFCE